MSLDTSAALCEVYPCVIRVAIEICGLSQGANPTNKAWFGRFFTCCAVPVLPAAKTGKSLKQSKFSTTMRIPEWMASHCWVFNTSIWFFTVGAYCSMIFPSASFISFSKVSSNTVPRLATAVTYLPSCVVV